MNESREGEGDVVKNSRKTERSPVKKMEKKRNNIKRLEREIKKSLKMMLDKINEGFEKQERIWKKEMKRKYREQMVK